MRKVGSTSCRLLGQETGLFPVDLSSPTSCLSFCFAYAKEEITHASQCRKRSK